MRLYLFLFHNWRGVLGVSLTALLAWLIVLQWLGGRHRDFLWVWMFFASIWAALTDRIQMGQSWYSYWNWIELSMCPELQSHVNQQTRISVFGVPLVVYPLLALTFSVLFPLIDKTPLPPADYYRDGIICAIASYIVYMLAKPFRDLDSLDCGRTVEESALVRDR